MWIREGSVFFAETKVNQDEILSLGAFSANCDYTLHIPQIWFTLCEDMYGDYFPVYWSGFISGQSGQYLERSGGSRSERYYTIFKDSSYGLAMELEEEIYATHHMEEEQVFENKEDFFKFSEVRKKAIPNFILITNNPIIQ